MNECRQSAAKEMTKQKAYLLGVFLGDGSVSKNKMAFSLQAIDKDFVKKTEIDLKSCVKNSVRFTTMNRKTSADKTVYAVYGYDVEFCRWLFETTKGRKHLPEGFYQWPIELRNELISGLLDSEGYVAMSRIHDYNGKKVFDMRIGVGACDEWVKELHSYCKEIGILVGALFEEKRVGHPVFYKFIFNKKSFIEHNLYFNIKRKQDRIESYKKLFPGSTTTRRIPKTKYTKDRISDFAKTRKRVGGRFVKVMI